MTSVVPATAGDANDPVAAEPQEGVSSLSDTQRRWCIGAAVVVMGLASLGTALYQTSSADVDPSANADAIAPLETSTSGSEAAAPAAGLPGGAYGLPGAGMGADALPPLSLLPGGAAGALPPSSGGIPSSAGVPDYVSPAPAQPRVVQSPGLGPEAAPPLASLPPGGATAPSSAAGTAGGPPGAAGTSSAAGASPYRQTGTPGVIQVAPGQAPPPGYRRVYPGPPRQQAAPGTAQQRSRTTPSTQDTTPGTASSPQRRTAPGTTSDDSSTSPSGSSTSPSTAPSGSSTAPSGRTAPRSQQPGLLGGLGG